MIQLLSYGTSKYQNYEKYHFIWTYHHEKKWHMNIDLCLCSDFCTIKSGKSWFGSFLPLLYSSEFQTTDWETQGNTLWNWIAGEIFFKGYKFLDLNSVSYDLLKAWKVEEKNRLMFHVGKVYCNYNYDYNYTTIICYKSAFCTLLETMKTLQSPS